MTATQTVHKFEIAGLGKYPFRCVAIVERSQPNGDGTTQPTGTCDYCGSGIKYCCVIRSADGKTFDVGTDCVRKSDDRGLVNMLRRAQQAARNEKRAAEWKAKQDTPEMLAKRVRENAERAEAQAKFETERAIITAEQAWIIEALAGQSGDFCRSMAEELTRRRFSDLSERTRNIITEIYAKQFGRYNSKAYWSAVEEFEEFEARIK